MSIMASVESPESSSSSTVSRSNSASSVSSKTKKVRKDKKIKRKKGKLVPRKVLAVGLVFVKAMLVWHFLVDFYFLQPSDHVEGPSAFFRASEYAFSKVVKQEQERAAQRQQKEFDAASWTSRAQRGLSVEDLDKIAGIYSTANSVYEFGGLGESAYIADLVDVPRYSGSDSNVTLVEECRQNVNDAFRFYYADIGEIREHGHPRNNHAKNLFDYQVAPLLAEPLPFDVYMLDGRFRFPLMALSFLHAAARGANRWDTRVVLHDCWKAAHSPEEQRLAKRSIYEKADHMLDLVEHSGYMLCVYKRKPETTDNMLYDLWKEYYHNHV